MHAVVTGASQGIGRATALRLAKDGADVAIHYLRHASEAEGLLQEIRAIGRNGFTVAGDLTDPRTPSALAADIGRHWDTVDVLVHNGGTYPRVAFPDTTDADFEEQSRMHVIGPASLTRSLLPALKRSSSGRIIFVSSLLAWYGSRRGAPYAAAKAAQLGLARSLARELAPGITVNIVAPGAIDTAILAGDTPEQRAARAQAVPANRIGTADDIASAISYLASPGAAYLTGATIHVNGGYLMP